jgi:hypothetical protein
MQRMRKRSGTCGDSFARADRVFFRVLHHKINRTTLNWEGKQQYDSATKGRRAEAGYQIRELAKEDGPEQSAHENADNASA